MEHPRAVFPYKKKRICYFLLHCSDTGPSALVKAAHNSQTRRLLQSTMCLNIHPATHLAPASGCPFGPSSSERTEQTQLCFQHPPRHLSNKPCAKAHCKNLITNQAPPTTLLLAETLHLSHLFTTTPSLDEPAHCQGVIDCKCSLNPIQMIHLCAHFPTAAFATDSSTCNHRFPFIRTWPCS